MFSLGCVHAKHQIIHAQFSNSSMCSAKDLFHYNMCHWGCPCITFYFYNYTIFTLPNCFVPCLSTITPTTLTPQSVLSPLCPLSPPCWLTFTLVIMFCTRVPLHIEQVAELSWFTANNKHKEIEGTIVKIYLHLTPNFIDILKKKSAATILPFFLYQLCISVQFRTWDRWLFLRLCWWHYILNSGPPLC